MLYLLHGELKSARDQSRKISGALLSKKKNAAIHKIDPENFSVDELDERIGSSGLFSERSIVILDSLLEFEEGREGVIDRLKEISESPNIFIVIEEKPGSADLKRLGKYAEKVQSFNLQPITNNQEQKFNIFNLTNALGNRDKKKLWTLYREAISNNVLPEEAHSVLLWQLKTMLSVMKSNSPKELELKPFVLANATKFNKNYEEGELATLLSSLIFLYHNARRGVVDFEIELERILLSV